MTAYRKTMVLAREAEWHDRVILRTTRDHMPRGRRMRVLPGVLGTMLSYAGGSIAVDVAVADLRRYLDRTGWVTLA